MVETPTRHDENMSSYAIEAEHVSKIYRDSKGQEEKKALDDVSLSIRKGSFFGLLGPNGAGKSTLINIFAGLSVRTSGSVRIWGHDIDRQVRQARRSIGVVPQELSFDPFFSPREVLEVYAGFYGVPKEKRRTDAILEMLRLKDKENAYARALSGGMRRRLLIAKAMVHAPPVLVLDEPTAGVDVELRHQLWACINELNAKGTTILLTTHYLEEAQELCDEIAIIHHGKLRMHDKTQTLLKNFDHKEICIHFRHDLETPPDCFSGFNIKEFSGNKLTLHYQPSQTSINDILNALSASGLEVLDLAIRETELEDIFLRMVQGSS